MRLPSLCNANCVCVERELQSVSTRVYNNTTLNVVVEWRQLAAICVNVYVQVRA